MAKKWTQADIDYLEDKWGTIARNSIAKNLGRTEVAVVQKARKIGLTDPFLHYDGITAYALADVIGIPFNVLQNWINKYGFPVSRKRLASKKYVFVIKYQDWWAWAEKNKQMIDFSRFDHLALAPEPDWVGNKRRADITKKSMLPKEHNAPWTKFDDDRLIQMATNGKYTFPDISKLLQRSQGAIKLRLRYLGVKVRPKYLETHNKYTAQEVAKLEEMMFNGNSFVEIAAALNRSESGVKGKAERMGYKFKNGVPYKVEVG